LVTDDKHTPDATSLSSADDSRKPLIDKLEEILLSLREEYTNPAHNYPWIIAFSSGKDSTLLAQLVLEVVLDLAPGDRRRTIYLTGNDTLVESPLLARHLTRMLERIAQAAETLRIPLTTVKTIPAPDQTFWVNLIGRGYRPPTRLFRWCTDRLKIRPTSEFIRSHVSRGGELILLLGVRRSESTDRTKIVERYSNGERLNRHNDLSGCWIYRPLLDLTTDEVWALLLQRRPPWGGSHRELITIYRNAQGAECPLVVDRSSAPACGSSAARFGCWTCTVVKRDRSLEGLIDAGYEEFEPLSEFREWLAEIGGDSDRRQLIRRNEQIKYSPEGKLVPGPFTLPTRLEILKRLLSLQAQVGRELISAEEISHIHRLWCEDESAWRLGPKSLNEFENPTDGAEQSTAVD
jgi:DNA sulfur modification protein DndC